MEKKDPIIRFQAYLIKKGFLSLEQAAQIEKDAQEEIVASHQKVEQTGTQMPLREIFEHTYEKMTPQLEEQFEECQAFLQTKEGK